MGWFNKNKKPQIEAATTVSAYEKFKHNETFLFKFDKPESLRKLDEIDELVDIQTFVIFKNDDEFYLQVLSSNYRFRDLEKYFGNGWKECYVFGNTGLSFHSGIDKIFAQQLLNAVRRSSNAGTVYNEYYNIGDPSNVLTIVEQNEYEQVWKDLKTIAKRDLVDMFPIDEVDLKILMGRSLFNIEKDNRLGGQIKNEDVLHILSSGEDSIVEYTLQDNLGHMFSANTVHQLFTEWAKSLCRIPRYKSAIIELLEHDLELGWGESKKLFYDWSGYYTNKRIDEDLYLNLREIRNDKSSHISAENAKKRMMILASLLNIRININEKNIAKVSDMINNSSFEEDMEREELKRNEKRTKLVAKLEKIAEDDFQRFDEDFRKITNENESSDDDCAYLTPVDEILGSEIEDDFISFEEEDKVRLTEMKDEMNREQQSAAMENALSELLTSSDQEFNKIFNKNRA